MLGEALDEEGFKVVIYKEGKTIDVRGKKVNVHVAVTGGKMRLWGNAGFERIENGTLKLHCDDMDTRKVAGGKVKQSYAEKQLMKQVRRMGKWTLKNRSVTKDGKRKITLVQVMK